MFLNLDSGHPIINGTVWSCMKNKLLKNSLQKAGCYPQNYKVICPVTNDLVA